MRRIRSRLILAFVIVALLPAIPLSYVVWSLLERSFGPQMGETVAEALQAGLEESRERLRAAKGGFQEEVEEIWVPRIRAEEITSDQGSVEVLGERRPLIRFLAASDGAPRSEAEAELIRWAARAGQGREGTILAGPERVGGCLAVVVATRRGNVLVAQALPPEMVVRAERIVEAMGFLEALRIERGAVLRSYVVPFILCYLVLLLLAIGLGAFLARRIARPLESLVASTRRVAEGDLTTRVSLSAQGEVRDLEKAFNSMMKHLSIQRRDLARLERKAAWRDLAQSLAHEIKNPLTPIQLAVQEIGDRYKGKDEEYRRILAECVEIVKEELRALRNLVREFSEFARLPEPKPRRGDLRVVLSEIARLYGPEKVAFERPEDEIIARFDGEEVRRALINLVDNGLSACQATGRPERVTLAVSRESSGVQIDVSDEGCGIAPGDLERIFEPQFSTKTGGMGLGLPIVEGIVRAHGGTIEVASRLGKGTTFAIRLPEGKQERVES